MPSDDWWEKYTTPREEFGAVIKRSGALTDEELAARLRRSMEAVKLTWPGPMNEATKPLIGDCQVCHTPIGFIDCPTGGWWAHETHPDDGHDAENTDG